jgi:hypothetical protein
MTDWQWSIVRKSFQNRFEHFSPLLCYRMNLSIAALHLKPLVDGGHLEYRAT